ncbi:MAG: hypothetical protein PHO79_05480, partial [Desulfoplanes sp.]|nr:hypothetical protein [Desulfoplanes sp.]
EALACGCALVATRLPGIEEIFKELPAEVIRRIPLPRMGSVDTPDPDDETLFVQALAHALQAQIASVRTGFDVRQCSAVRGLLEQFTWSGVFERIDAVYHRLL